MGGNDLGTELCVAVWVADLDKVRDFLGRGADVNAIGDRRVPVAASQTPLWIAVRCAGRETSPEWADFCDAVNDVSPSVSRPDHTATRGKYIAIAQLLIQSGADINQLCHGSTPLRQAVSHVDPEMVKLLLRHGANPNVETFSPLSKLARKEGRKRLPGYWNTVLHEAVIRNSLPMVQALVAAGADLTRTDHERTPLDIAREKQYDAIAEFLEKAVASRRAPP